MWHDLSEDDLILPTNGTEFVLKGSELLDQLPSGNFRRLLAKKLLFTVVFLLVT